MKISPEEQQSRDFDWFCIDDADEIGHFATAGYKSLPQSVISSAEDLQALTAFFEHLPELTSSYAVDRNLAENVKDPNANYLRSYGAMAKRGLYSFDIHTYLERDTKYFRVTSPEKPLTAAKLPPDMRVILQRTRLSGKLLKQTAVIAYQHTLAM